MLASRISRRVVFALFIPIILIATVVAYGQLPSVQSATVEPWPSFQMVYKDWEWNRGPSNTPGYVIVRLTYENSRNWQIEILEDSVKPDAAGTRGSFNGQTSSGFNARFNQSHSESIPADVLLAPSDWLVPGRIARLRGVSGTIVLPTAAPDIKELVYNTQLPCEPTQFKCNSASRQIVTRIQFNTRGEIPVGMTVTSDGFVTRQITVTEFSFKR